MGVPRFHPKFNCEWGWNGIVQMCRNPNLGLATKARAYKGASQEWNLGATFHAPRSLGKCEGMNPTFPSELPLWELEFQWTPKFSKGYYKGQNSLDWRVIYIIGNLFELRCLKWARMTHLGISNICYGQKKGCESNCQFDYRWLKIRNRPDFLTCRCRAKYHWKNLDESYNFALDLTWIGGLHTKL